MKPLFIYDLFNNAVNSSDYSPTNGRTSNEMKRMWKGKAMAYFIILSQHLSGGTDNKYKFALF
jgi:hypothetical protein